MENKANGGLKGFLLLHGTLLIYAIVSVFAKYAGIQMAQNNWWLTLVFLGLEAFTLLVYSVLWQQVLKRMPLSFAYSNKGICTLWTALLGILLFGETITWGKALGILVVLIGVLLVVTDHE